MSNIEKVQLAFVVGVAVIATLILFLSNARQPTGAVSTNICPKGSTPIISGEIFQKELNDFERLGYHCFFGKDGITPCCERQKALP